MNKVASEDKAARQETPVELLEWDTEFFGFPVAQVTSDHLSEQDLENVLNFCRSNSVRLLQFKCDSNDRDSVLLAEANGFHFADVRITMKRGINNDFVPNRLPKGIGFRIAEQPDIDRLTDLADGIYLHSRYYFDRNFDGERVREFYRDWVRKAVEGTFDDEACLLCENNRPFAFCTIRFGEPRGARIGLVGMDPSYAGRDLARVLVTNSLAAIAARDVRTVDVVTQGRNYPAQRLYQKAGFLTSWAEIYYHLWFNT